MDTDSYFYVFKSGTNYCRFYAYDVGADGLLVGYIIAAAVRFSVYQLNGF